MHGEVAMQHGTRHRWRVACVIMAHPACGTCIHSGALHLLSLLTQVAPALGSTSRRSGLHLRPRGSDNAGAPLSVKPLVPATAAGTTRSAKSVLPSPRLHQGGRRRQVAAVPPSRAAEHALNRVADSTRYRHGLPRLLRRCSSPGRVHHQRRQARGPASRRGGATGGTPPSLVAASIRPLHARHSSKWPPRPPRLPRALLLPFASRSRPRGIVQRLLQRSTPSTRCQKAVSAARLSSASPPSSLSAST